jgi:hypothetical protein
MARSRTLFFFFVATMVTVMSGLHTGGALEVHGAKQYGRLPARFFTVISPAASAYLTPQADSQKPESDDPLPDGKGKDVVMRVCSGATP